MTNTRKNRRYCTRSCWRHCWHEILSIIKKSIPVVIAQLIGWALFSYVEDDLNILDCLSRPGSLAGRMHKVNDEKKREIELFTRLYFKTSQFLSENQSKVMYHQFKEHFDVPDPLYLSKDDAIFLGCIKWYRFSVMTMTTIGFGVVTPKTDTGKLLVIPYALVTMPLMLVLMAKVGAIASALTEKLISCINRFFKGSRPIKYKLVKETFFLFVILWLACFAFLLDIAWEAHALDYQLNTSWLDGLYFSFVTFTTIGFGDITQYADSISFYGFYLVIGLAVVSGLSNSLMALVKKLEFNHGPNSNCCCCFLYVEDETENT